MVVQIPSILVIVNKKNTLTNDNKIFYHNKLLLLLNDFYIIGLVYILIRHIMPVVSFNED